jgi:hypothetical protein
LVEAVKFDDTIDQVRRLLPLRDLPADERRRLGIVRQGRSRPRRIEPRPERDDYLEQVDQLRAEAASMDPLLTAATDPARGADVLDETLRALAVECASLAFERVQAEKCGRDVGTICSRRVSGLAQIANLVVERRRHEPDCLDVRGEKFQKLVTYFLTFLKEATEEVLGPDAERFLAAYRERLSGWEDRIDPRPPRDSPP